MSGRTMTDTHKKLCFVIGEIGATKTRERKIAMWLLNQIVEPVINEGFPDFEVRHGAMVLEQEHINKEILDNLTHAELVIANLSGATPGSLYQVGIRHATGLPMILMSSTQDRPLFDLEPLTTSLSSRRVLLLRFALH